jgi:hypothetical protein
VVVVSWARATSSSRRAAQIAAFLGADVESIVLDPAPGASRALPRSACLIVDADTIVAAGREMSGGENALLAELAAGAEHLFVHGFTESHAATLRLLTGDALGGVEALDAEVRFSVTGDRQWCGPFTGLSVPVPTSVHEARFVERSDDPRLDVMIRANGDPFLARTSLYGSQLFLSAAAEFADLDERVGRETPVLSCFSRLIPLMMFLRGALGRRLWHNDKPQACFIVDDPYLKKDRYGFLEYEKLLTSMRRLSYATCIAFIPWNHRRSSRRVAERYFSRTGATLCIHGCDHTRGEFLTGDLHALRAKAETALARMQDHTRRSGVAFDDVMVFPQGLFSTQAVAALKAAGYLAAVNSNPVPSTVPDGLALREWLDVAVSRFSDFPVFGRRYPREIAEFAFDLFLGRPILAVEHHGYFQSGYTDLETFVTRLNALDERIDWTGLGAICSRACVTRTDERGDVHVRFYTDRFLLSNDTDHPRRYLLMRQLSRGHGVSSVTVNDRVWPSTCEERTVGFEISLAAGETAHVRLRSTTGVEASPWRTPAMYATKAMIRRHLSDFRDNHVDTSRFLSALISARRD